MFPNHIGPRLLLPRSTSKTACPSPLLASLPFIYGQDPYLIYRTCGLSVVRPLLTSPSSCTANGIIIPRNSGSWVMDVTSKAISCSIPYQVTYCRNVQFNEQDFLHTPTTVDTDEPTIRSEGELGGFEDRASASSSRSFCNTWPDSRSVAPTAGSTTIIRSTTTATCIDLRAACFSSSSSGTNFSTTLHSIKTTYLRLE